MSRKEPFTGTMIEAVIQMSEDEHGSGWHFKYQPIDGGPVVSLDLVNHGPDFVELDLEDGSNMPFFVHLSAMRWAMIDWDCETRRPYIGNDTLDVV